MEILFTCKLIDLTIKLQRAKRVKIAIVYLQKYVKIDPFVKISSCKSEFVTVNKIDTTGGYLPTHQLDTTGLYCPEPVMLLHNKIRNIAEGELVEVTATDPSSWRDIHKFCEFLGHSLLKKEKTDKIFYYLIRKGSRQ